MGQGLMKYLKCWMKQQQLTRNRLNLVGLDTSKGDRPAIDTTEALAQLQSFQLASNDAWLNFRNSGLELSNFLWLPMIRHIIFRM